MTETAPITPQVLQFMLAGGVTWAVIGRRDATLKEAEAYAYRHTLVFPIYGDDVGLFLLAMADGPYAAGQLERYGSGLWATQPIDGPADAETHALAIHSRWVDLTHKGA